MAVVAAVEAEGFAAVKTDTDLVMSETPKIQKIAFIGDHLPRKCGNATFTSDLLAAVQSAHPASRCLAVSVNDLPGGYEYPDVVRFEIEEQDLSSYLRAADFLNISNVDVVCLQHEFGIYGGPAGGTAVDSELVLETHHVHVADIEEVRGPQIGREVLLFNFEAHHVGIFVSTRKVVDRDSQAAARRVRALDGSK